MKVMAGDKPPLLKSELARKQPFFFFFARGCFIFLKAVLNSLHFPKQAQRSKTQFTLTELGLFIVATPNLTPSS